MRLESIVGPLLAGCQGRYICTGSHGKERVQASAEFHAMIGLEVGNSPALTKGEGFTCLLPAFSALTMFLRASFITDIFTMLNRVSTEKERLVKYVRIFS